MNRFSPPLAALLVAALSVAGAAHAQTTIVDWGTSSTYVTADAVLNGYTTSGKAFDLTNEFNPQSGYSGPNFYGGASVVSTNGTGQWNATTGLLIKNNTTAAQSGTAGNDAFRFYPTWSGTTGDGQQKFYAAVAFPKSEFLNGGSSSTVSISGTESVNLSFFLASSGYQVANTNFRVLIKNGSDWYVSNTISYTAGTLKTVSSTFGSAFTGWSNYNTASLNSIGTAATPVFNDVQAIGYLWTLSSAVGNNNGTNGSAFVSDFTFNATLTPIPEPSTYAALAGLAALCGVMIHRRRKTKI